MSDAPPQPDPPPAATTKQWTQEEVNSLVGKARGEGRAAGRKEVLEEVGQEDTEAIKSALADHQARVDAEKTEAERARDEANAAKAEAEQAKAQMAATNQQNMVQLALIEAGCPAATLADVTRMVVVDADADADAVSEAVEALKSRVPQLFAAPEGAPPAPSGAPAGGTGDKRKKPSTKSGLSVGSDLFAARRGDT